MIAAILHCRNANDINIRVHSTEYTTNVWLEINHSCGYRIRNED